MVQKVDITPKDVIWSAKNDFVAIVGKESFFLLQYESDKVEKAISEMKEEDELEDGIEESFTLIAEIFELVLSGIWQNQVFFFLNNIGKLNYVVGSTVYNYCYVQNAVHILGVISNQDRLYFTDLKNNVLSQELSPSYADAITCIQNGE